MHLDRLIYVAVAALILGNSPALAEQPHFMELALLPDGSTLSSAHETLNFDDIAPSGNPPRASLQDGPWLLSSQQFHSVSLPAAGVLTLVDNGTSYIASAGGGLDYPITLERTDGSPFSLIAFDVAEGFLDDLLAAQEGFVSATKVEAEAALTSGFAVTLEFDLDGLRDGPNGVDDFETLTMSDSLLSVTSVTFTGLAGNRRDAGFALDNVVVAAVVPEPAPLVLVGLAAAMFGVWRKRRSRTK